MTKQPVEHGLAEVASSLQPQLRMAVASVTLRHNQAQRLLNAMLGSITELKAYDMLGAGTREAPGHRSTVSGFDGTLRHLFPEIEEGTEEPAQWIELDITPQALGKLLLQQRQNQEHCHDQEPKPQDQISCLSLLFGQDQ